MISRTLVPQDARLSGAEPEARGRRRQSTALDARTLVPSDLPVAALDARTSIPAHLPLEVLATRVIVPRDMPLTPLDATSSIPAHVPLTVLDSRIAVPKDARPAAVELGGEVPRNAFADLLEPNVLTTGEVTLLARPVEERISSWRWAARTSSFVFHTLLLALVLFQPKLFPYRPPTQAEMDLARRQLAFVYLPPEVVEVPRVQPRAEPSSPQMRIDPRVLRQVAPPTTELQPLPGQPQPEHVQRDLPAAPTPQVTPGDSARREPPREPLRLETPKDPQNPSGLILPRASPGKALEESLRGALESRRGGGGEFGGPIPSAPGGGGGTGYLGGNIQMLTPDEGVDFTNYLARVLASVKRNWYAVIPESARMGEKGRVVLQFHIMRDGAVPFPEPALRETSGKEPLDRAAMASIRASNPFEPLPPAFSGPYIELRFIFLYNLPLDYQ